MTLEFHMTPGSCTTGIHILLEDLALPFQVSIFTTKRYLPGGQAPETGYAMGADFGIADAALLYVLFWASKTQIALPPRCQALFERIRARPVVQQVLREEGYR
jgi:hypothetical protein